MKVLIVSNDRALLRHVSRFLGTFGYETEQVANYQRAAEIADSISADLLLVDSEPDFDRALGLCRAVSERTGSASHYTLLMVDKRSPNQLLDAVAAGADDILLKPIVYGEVLRRLHAGVRAVEFRRRAGRQRRRDSVTGLLTCAAFQARMQAAGASQAYREEPFACVTIAIDFFEATLCDVGQHAEHTLLGELGSLVERLCDNERADLAHFGNGLFCVSLPGTTIAEALQLAEKVRSEIGKNDFLVDGTKVALTASAGVGGAETLSGPPIAVFEKSKQALKTAQASGHDCVLQANQFAEEEVAWRELAAPGRLFERTVARDVMVACTVVLHATDSIGYALSLFQQTRLACMVVVEGDREFAGTASAEDVAEYLQASGDPDEPISQIMVRSVDTVKEATPFADLMGYFAGSDSELVVVVDGNRPTGIVSAASLAALSQAPQQPACCAETPSMGSSYLQVTEPLDLPCTTDTV